jgi:hypothetical protein
MFLVIVTLVLLLIITLVSLFDCDKRRQICENRSKVSKVIPFSTTKGVFQLDPDTELVDYEVYQRNIRIYNSVYSKDKGILKFNKIGDQEVYGTLTIKHESETKTI